MVHRRGINDNQLRILKLIYKFRFVSPNLISDFRKVSVSSVNQSLKVLVDRKYIDRRYSNEDKIAGKYASYYLTTDGIELLKTKIKTNDHIVHSFYHNAKVHDNFINKFLDIFRVYTVLNRTYPATFNIFTLSESKSLDYMPEQRPDLYLNRIKQSKAKSNQYFLNILTDNRLFITKKLIETYIEHYDSNNWPKSEYPTLLLVCPSPTLEKGIQRHIENQMPDFDVLTTTLKALLGSDDKKIWSNALEPEELISL